MKFIEIINNKKLTLISIFLFLYVLFNLFDGDRGLISYYDKVKIKQRLILEEKSLIAQLNFVEKKNNLLNENIDSDYLEILYRKKFLVGKARETIYINNYETKTSRKN